MHARSIDHLFDAFHISAMRESGLRNLKHPLPFSIHCDPFEQTFSRQSRNLHPCYSSGNGEGSRLHEFSELSGRFGDAPVDSEE